MIIFDKDAFLKNNSYTNFDIEAIYHISRYRDNFKTAFDLIKYHEVEFLNSILRNIPNEGYQWDETMLQKLILLEE